MCVRLSLQSSSWSCKGIPLRTKKQSMELLVCTMTDGAVGVGGHLSCRMDVGSSDGDQLNPR